MVFPNFPLARQLNEALAKFFVAKSAAVDFRT
jgi:hypothetical protein